MSKIKALYEKAKAAKLTLKQNTMQQSEFTYECNVCGIGLFTVSLTFDGFTTMCGISKCSNHECGHQYRIEDLYIMQDFNN